MLASTLAARAADSGTLPPIICTILLIATVIAFIIGLAELLGLFALRSFGGTRFGSLIVAIILLVVYVIAC